MPKNEYEIITGLLVVIFILLMAGSFIVILVTLNNRRKKKHLDEKKMMQIEFKQEILNTQMEIKEQTLKHISQEIHDNIGQILSLVKLNLGTTDFSHPEKVMQKVEDSKMLVGKAIQDLRDLSKSLNTDYVSQMGLARSVEYELEMVKKMGIFETRFDIFGNVFRFSEQTELILFRIVQESLNNIIKHSKATGIQLTLDYRNQYFKMSIRDNGQGFEAKNVTNGQSSLAGIGIRNMQNRAAMIQADLSVISSPEEGTLICLSIPINSSSDV